MICMELSQAVDQLHHNYQEIRMQSRLLRMRRILRFLLIGFLIGRDSSVKISKLEMENKRIVNELFNHFYKGISEKKEDIILFSNAYVSLVQLGEEIRLFEKENADANSLLFYAKEMLSKYHEMLVSHVKSLIETEEKALAKKVEKILNSGTYLIHNDKQDGLKALEAFRDELNCCEQSEIIEERYIEGKKSKIEEFRQQVTDYNDNFVNKREEEYRVLWQKGLLSLDDEQQTAIVTDDSAR
jgi:hypothetical protein